MSQSKAMSFVESLTNVAVGLVVSLISQIVIFGFYGIHISLGQNIAMTFWFTLISIIRSYALRRIFNGLRGA